MMAKPRSVFAELHEKPGCFVMPNPWDVGSAKLLASLGFPALATSSAGAAMSLGHLDGGIAGEGLLAHAAQIVTATGLPVNGDLMNGSGDSPRAVEAAIRGAFEYGLSGASIEDTRLENPEEAYYLADAAERIAAAAEMVSSFPEPFILTARADGYLSRAYDLKEVIERLQAFQEAGADVLYAPGLKKMEQVRTVLAEVDLPLNVLLLGGADFTPADLAAAGVKRISVGSRLYYHALGSLKTFAAGLDVSQEGAPPADPISYAEVATAYESVFPDEEWVEELEPDELDGEE